MRQHTGSQLVANSFRTPTYQLRLGSLLVVTLLTLTACAGPGEVGETAASSVDEKTRSGSEEPADEVEAPVGQSEGSSEEAEDEQATDEGPFDFDEFLAAVVESEPVLLDNEAIGSDLILGGSPDTVSAAAITRGLEDAGVDLSGIEVSVLPITGRDASLVVFEVTNEDEVVISGEGQSDDDDAFMKTLLAMPEVEEASITELVTIYRGVDDQGSFVVTFTVSISALEEALASGSEIGDDMLVQVERGA